MGVSIINYTHLEDFINELYRSLAITNPQQLQISYVAKLLKLKIYYGNVSLRYENKLVIKKSNRQREWQLFGHEVGHYLRHSGNHLPMYPLFRDLQEYQANFFAYHFCVPTFMLMQVANISVYEIMNQFNVDYKFASRRLEMYQNKILIGG